MAETKRIPDLHTDFVLAPHMVVFSHGFGVDRTDRGLFTDVVAALPNDYGYVMFDYNTVDGKDIHISSLADQQRMLLSLITWLSEQSSVTDISLVAHSVGCIVAALAKPAEINRMVMLAPPLDLSRLGNRYTSRESVSRQGSVWQIPRSDGTTTYVPNTLFTKFAKLDATQTLLEYASVQPFELLIPTDDEVLGEVDYNDLSLNEAITALTIDEADHNFTATSRPAVIRAIIDWLCR